MRWIGAFELGEQTSFQGTIDRLKLGDTAAATDVHQRFAEKLIRLAQRRLDKRLRHKFDADDVVQSAFFSFFRRHANGQFEFESWNNLWSLLASITIRKCGRRSKNYSMAKRDVRRERPAGSEEYFDAISADEPTPDEAVLLEETLEALLDELTEEQRDVLLLKLQNHSNEEISQRIGRTERTVYRVLGLIRQRLTEIEGEVS